MNPLFVVGQIMSMVPWGLIFAGPGVAVQAAGLVIMIVVMVMEH